MRVAFDVGPVRAQPAGVALYATSIARALAQALKPTELTLIGRRPDAAGLPDGIPAVDRTPRLPYPAWVEIAAAREARSAGADITHYSDGIAPLVRHGRTVLAVHDMSVVRQWRTHRMRRWARIPLVLSSPWLADVVVVPSRATADEVMALTRLPSKRIEVVPYAPQASLSAAEPAHIAEVLARLGLPQHGYILALGTIEPRKNHLRLIQAFERLLATTGRDLQLVIAGKPAWASDPVLKRIETSSQRDRIHQLGYVAAGDLAPLITGAGAVAYVSLYEGFGLPVVEAMSCGAPTVTSSISSMPEIAGEAAFLVNPYDVDAIARGLDAATSTSLDRRFVADRATRQVAGFTWVATGRAVVDVYRRLTS